MRYRAFISYSHRDAKWARWLHRAVESYRTPARLRGTSGEFGPLPDRLQPVFRDREDLASSGSLSPKIAAALAGSEALLVVCSPDAARSPWVDQEIARFKRLGRANRIYCLIVAGEPNAGDARECFAPSLRHTFDGNGEPTVEFAEPVAADVRPGTDGRSLARLKLLSGLLGVELDALRRRETARRQRRLLAIAAVSCAVMLVTTALAVQAVVARHAAERRQKQAEALVGFMLGTLTEKLSQMSRLDLMESVNDQTMDYLQSLPVDDVTDQSLEQRATVLAKIGNVRRDQGHLAAALQSYEAASALSGKLALSAPTDVERQISHARARAYIGTTRWYQGDLGLAEDSFRQSQAILQSAQPLAPDHPELLYQLSTVDNNIGHVLESRGRHAAAAVQYRNMLALAERLVRIDPTSRRWGAQAGLAHNNLAKMSVLGGALGVAVSEYRADLAIEAALAAADPQDNDLAEKGVISRAALGRTLALTGDLAGGTAELQRSIDGVAALLAVDADNTSFQEDDGLYAIQLARLLRAGGDAVGARALAARGVDRFERLTAKDPANAAWQRALAGGWIEQAEQARDGRRANEVRDLATRASGLLEPQRLQRPDDRDTLLAALSARRLLASVAPGTPDASRWLDEIVATAAAQTSGRNDPRLIALQVDALLALGRKADAVAMLPALWATDFREPAILAQWATHDVRGPTPPAGEAAPR